MKLEILSHLLACLDLFSIQLVIMLNLSFVICEICVLLSKCSMSSVICEICVLLSSVKSGGIICVFDVICHL